MNTTEETLFNILDQFFQLHPVPSESTLFVGFSGGPDSCALALLLARRFGAHRLTLTYLNHRLRSLPEQEEEERFVERFAREEGFGLIKGALEPGGLEREASLRGGLEAAARRERYRFFDSVTAKVSSPVFFLGHHRDDQRETQVMRFFQGSGPAGLRGMIPVRDYYYRPLLKADKKWLLDYLKSQSKDFVVDRTNSQTDYLRNRLRHEVIPLIREVFPGLDSSLDTLGQKMEDLHHFVLEESRTRVCWHEEGEGLYSLPVSVFTGVPELLLRESLYGLANRTLKNHSRIPYHFFTPLFTGDRDPGEGVLLSGFGYRLVRRGGMIFWEQDVVFPGKNSYLIKIQEDRIWEIDGISFHTMFLPGSSDSREIPGGVFVPADQVSPPLVARSRRPGDRIPLSGGSRSLKKLYNQWNVSEEKRWALPVLEDRMGIGGVLGDPWGYPNQFCERWSERDKNAGLGGWLFTWT
jgi:tRNA(Ile)-lysidine synthase